MDALARLVKMQPRCVVDHCRDLKEIGWMRLPRKGKRIQPEALVPREIELRLAKEIRKAIEVSPFKGETTTTFFIEWIVAPSVQLILHARPDFLRNKDTGQNLEYDIFAPDYKWATEYHGDQHYGVTTRYPSKDEYIERIKRDQMKVNLSDANGIRLSVANNRNLNLDGILKVIPKDVPLRAFDPKGPMVLTLEQLGFEIAGNQGWDRD